MTAFPSINVKLLFIKMNTKNLAMTELNHNESLSINGGTYL